VFSRMKDFLDDEAALFDADRLAKKLNISRPTVERLRADGVFVAIKARNRNLYDLAECVAALKARSRSGVSQ